MRGGGGIKTGSGAAISWRWEPGDIEFIERLGRDDRFQRFASGRVVLVMISERFVKLDELAVLLEVHHHVTSLRVIQANEVIAIELGIIDQLAEWPQLVFLDRFLERR